MDAPQDFGFDTLAVRSGTARSDFNEHSEAIFLTSSFVFASAADAAERFKNSEDYFTYSRFTNPTVSMFQDRLAALEGGEACIATASGMAAIMSVVMSTLQQPLKLGADVVMHSATKFLDGQGRVLGGALVGSKQFIMEKVFPFVRSAGPTLSAFNAWVLLKGMETLSLRVEKQSANALEIARWLDSHPAVNRVFYPGLESHPQHALARRQQKSGGAILSFELKGDTPEQMRANAWRVIDGTKVCSITGNLGDTRTTITHPATTTHGRITPEARAAASISEGLIRLAVGLENAGDIRADLQRGLEG
ncbi:PLP-dependent transferase [Paraburkholderia sp. MMS20-SJTN17]|uniref:PLP-dependent transferase n=1 Tax=Paraburkholderia translucens TaxID=2886945 RepID=A0ABS8KLN8_9BURK|nr:PLP-dependent transferase [Paraburkholderia sp. MMS20-SJTN17]MCC8405676.1 PLP-dependent transferase [Paraburkholderia sp. MMS20-SJTN17]